MSEEQILTCLGCGSRWRLRNERGKATVLAVLVECPLCENPTIEGELEV